MSAKEHLETKYEIYRTPIRDIREEKKFDFCPKCCVELESWLGEKNELEHNESI